MLPTCRSPTLSISFAIAAFRAELAVASHSAAATPSSSISIRMMAVTLLETSDDGSIVGVATIVGKVEGSGAENNDGFGDGTPVDDDEGAEDGGNVRDDDGESVGSRTGTCVGVWDCCAAGAKVRRSDIVGSGTGTWVGVWDGCAVGAKVGGSDIVGSGTGRCVGVWDGCTVGARVGGSDIVGDVVGWSNTSPAATQK